MDRQTNRWVGNCLFNRRSNDAIATTFKHYLLVQISLRTNWQYILWKSCWY